MPSDFCTIIEIHIILMSLSNNPFTLYLISFELWIDHFVIDMTGIFLILKIKDHRFFGLMKIEGLVRLKKTDSCAWCSSLKQWRKIFHRPFFGSWSPKILGGKSLVSPTHKCINCNRNSRKDGLFMG